MASKDNGSRNKNYCEERAATILPMLPPRYLLARHWTLWDGTDSSLAATPAGPTLSKSQQLSKELKARPWTDPVNGGRYNIRDAVLLQSASDIETLGGYEALIRLADTAAGENQRSESTGAATETRDHSLVPRASVWGDLDSHRCNEEELRSRLELLRPLLDLWLGAAPGQNEKRWWEITYLVDHVAMSNLANQDLTFIPRSESPVADTRAKGDFIRSWPWEEGLGYEAGKLILDESNGLWAAFGVLFHECEIVEALEVPF